MAVPPAERNRPSVALGHLAAERLSNERAEALRLQLAEQQERLSSRRTSIVDRHPGVERAPVKSSKLDWLDIPGGCLEVLLEVPFRLLFKSIEVLLEMVGGILEGLGSV